MRINDMHSDAFFLNTMLDGDLRAAELKRWHMMRQSAFTLYLVTSVGLFLIIGLNIVHPHRPEIWDLSVAAYFLFAKMSYNNLDTKIKFLKLYEAQQLPQQDATSSS